jgi:hypothetical protein
VYLKVLSGAGSLDDVNPRLTFVLAAPRLEWHPDRVDLPANISPDKVFLADLGFDVASLDDVTPRSELVSADRESFYQLLAAMSRTNRAALAQVIGERVPVSQLLRHEEQHRGRLCEFVGSARSVTRVVVDDPDIRFRLGIKHYYEIVVFVDPDVTIQFVGAGQEPKEFATYPIVFCCRQIPRQLPIGQGMQVLVRTRGAFLKNWAYPSRYVTGTATGKQPLQMQLSPLLLGYSPEILPAPHMHVPALDRLVMVLFFVGLTGMAALVWWSGRKDRRAAILRRAGSLPERIEMPEAGP